MNGGRFSAFINVTNNLQVRNKRDYLTIGLDELEVKSFKILKGIQGHLHVCVQI